MTILTKREQHLLMVFAENEHCMTSQQLSTMFNLSSKTIRTEIKNINVVLQDFAFIKAIPAKGYHLDIKDKNQFKAFIQSFNRSWEMLTPSNPLERAHYILGILLKEEGFIKIDDVAERLYIDRTSVSRALKYARRSLERYGLKMLQKPGKGLCIIGDEFQYRQCIAEYIYHKSESFITAIGQKQDLISKIKDTIFNDGILIPERSFQNFIIHLQVQIDRMSSGHFIQFTDDEKKEIYEEYEHLVALDVSYVIQQFLNISFSENEICYLTIHILGKKNNSISMIENCINNQLKEDINHTVSNILEHIKECFGLDLNEDGYLRKGIGVHIGPMKKRLRFNTYLRNPMLDSIKLHYPLAYIMSIESWSSYGYDMNIEDELGYLAVHFQYALERRKRHISKKRVLLVNDYNVAVGELASLTILKKYRDTMSIERSVSMSELYHVDLSCYDMIISLVPVDLQTQVPIIKIHPIMQKKDIILLNRYFESHENNTLKQYITRQDVHHLSFNDLEDVYKWIYHQEMKKVKMMKDTSSLMGFELNNAIAIYYILDGESKCGLSIYHLSKPILWKNQLVKIVFVARINHQFEETEKMFNALSCFFEQTTWIENLLKETSLEKIYHLLTSYVS